VIRPEQIPDEVAFALLDIYALWHGDTAQARAAIAAALNAWPGAELDPYPQGTGKKAVVKWYLDLPLPQEKSDGE
jgi:hypothetical protein